MAKIIHDTNARKVETEMDTSFVFLKEHYEQKIKQYNEKNINLENNLANSKKKSENLTKLREYSQLEDNWNFEGAKAFSKKLIDLTWDKIGKFEIQPEVFPTMRESIQFEYEKENGDYLEFEIYEDKIEVFDIINKSENEYTLAVSDDLNNIVNDFHGI